jgi:hypothetical protein
MKRLLILWLTLFPAFWRARTVASALLWQRIDPGFGAFFQLVTIPLLHTLAVGWATRVPGPLPLSDLFREVRARRLLLGLLLADGLVIAFGAVFHRGLFFSLALQGLSLPGLFAGAQAVAAGVLIAHLAYRERWTRLEGIRLGVLSAALLAWGFLLARDWLHPLTDYLLLDVPLLQRWLAVDASLLAVGIALVLGAQPLFDRRNPAAGAALDAAVGLWVLGAAITALGLFGVEAPTEPWVSIGGACTLLAATALLAGALLAQGGEVEGFDPGEV